MDATPDHRWLMQYNIVNLVNQCRRLIRAEFDESLSLTDPALRQKLAHYAGHTRSQGLQRLYGEIRLALLELEGEDSPPAPSNGPAVRLYRGQPVDTPTSDKETPRSQHTPRKGLMYRGRKVAG
ncbi:hypothetical protein [Alcanivorax sp.]|uniref:hypothetical protein n=1 Tax=Alcanivorax sp. TaxID=1872427 RepID=UPI0025C21E8C|nr:hypothetical protein [Alcanivorax sp.]